MLKTLINFTLFIILTYCNGMGEKCWKRSYGRGVGVPLSTCNIDEEKSGLLCYPKCREDYTGVGPMCWQNCPPKFKDHGMFCRKPSSYGRGVGYAIWNLEKCENENPQGCERHLAMWYPRCQDGFHPVGCCICSPDCPNEMTDIGISCSKKSYGRTVDKPMKCKPEQEYDAALCYKYCEPGYYGVGPVCWKYCPAGYSDCGAICSAIGCLDPLKDILKSQIPTLTGIELGLCGGRPQGIIEGMVSGISGFMDVAPKTICE